MQTLGAIAIISMSRVVAAADDSGPSGGGIAAGTNSVWIWEHPASLSEGPIRFAQCELGVGATWRCRRGPSVVGRIAAVCPTGRDVVVLFKDGTVRGFAAPRPTLGESVTSTSTLQPGLPEQALPFRVASDPKRERLFALTSAEVARQFVRRRVAKESSTRNDDPPLRFGRPRGAADSNPGGGGLLDRPSTENVGADSPRSRSEREAAAEAVPDSVAYCVLRFEGGAWSYDRAAPGDLREPNQVIAFWAAASGPRILLRSPVDPAIAELRRSEPEDAGWISGAPLSVSMDSAVIAAGFDDDADEDVVAVVAQADDGDAGGRRVSLWRRGQGDWRAVGVLSRRPDGVASFMSGLSLAVSGKEIFTRSGDGSEDTTVGVWSAVDGVDIGTFQVPTEILSPTPPVLNPIARHAIEYAALAVVLTCVFVWRRDRMIDAVVLLPGQMPASFQRRVAAFLVDVIVLAPVTVPTLWWLWGASLDGPVSWEELLRAAEATSSPLFWTGGVFGAEFGVYAAVFEWWMGATPGKRIFGCRVVGDGGAPCRFRDVVIRNAVRAVEFHFTASFLVTFLTPGRQRMGDLLARTLVVERCEVEPMKQAGADEPSE